MAWFTKIALKKKMTYLSGSGPYYRGLDLGYRHSQNGADAGYRTPGDECDHHIPPGKASTGDEQSRRAS